MKACYKRSRGSRIMILIAAGAGGKLVAADARLTPGGCETT